MVPRRRGPLPEVARLSVLSSKRADHEMRCRTGTSVSCVLAGGLPTNPLRGTRTHKSWRQSPRLRQLHEPTTNHTHSVDGTTSGVFPTPGSVSYGPVRSGSSRRPHTRCVCVGNRSEPGNKAAAPGPCVRHAPCRVKLKTDTRNRAPSRPSPDSEPTTRERYNVITGARTARSATRSCSPSPRKTGPMCSNASTPACTPWFRHNDAALICLRRI